VPREDNRVHEIPAVVHHHGIESVSHRYCLDIGCSGGRGVVAGEELFENGRSCLRRTDCSEGS
jgi:hypothetical protein